MLSLPEGTISLSFQIEKEHAKSDKETFVCTVQYQQSMMLELKDVRF
jgi:hypothetical protein